MYTTFLSSGQDFFTDKDGNVIKGIPSWAKIPNEPEVSFLICVKNDDFKEDAKTLMDTWERA